MVLCYWVRIPLAACGIVGHSMARMAYGALVTAKFDSTGPLCTLVGYFPLDIATFIHYRDFYATFRKPSSHAKLAAYLNCLIRNWTLFPFPCNALVLLDNDE